MLKLAEIQISNWETHLKSIDDGYDQKRIIRIKEINFERHTAHQKNYAWNPALSSQIKASITLRWLYEHSLYFFLFF